MAVEVRTLPVHAAALNALVTTLALAETARARAEFSLDPQSSYRQAKAVVDETLLQLRALSIAMLRQVEEDVAASGLVADLTDRAVAAAEEAARLDAATDTIADIAGVVGRVAGIVGGIARLPFV